MKDLFQLQNFQVLANNYCYSPLYKHIFLCTLEFLDLLHPIYISHSDVENLGKKYSMSCTVIVEPILKPYLVIELSQIQFHDRITMTETLNDTLQLFIPSLNTSVAALYTCTAIVKVPGTEFTLRNSKNFTLTLKSESVFV